MFGLEKYTTVVMNNEDEETIMVTVKIEKKRTIIDSLFVFCLILDIISSHVPMGNYIDEMVSLLALVGQIVFLLREKKVSKSEFVFILCILGMVVLGIVSDIYWNYFLGIGVIIKDIVGIFKFFICFAFFNRVVKEYDLTRKNDVVLISKFLILCFFLFGFLSLFVDIGMGDSVRFGLRSYKFMYSFYNVLVFNTLILLAVLMTSTRANLVYYLMGFSVLILTLRTKALIVIVLVAVFKLMDKKKELVKKGIAKKLKFIIPIVIVVSFIVKDKIALYVDFGRYNSIRIGALFTGIEIAGDCFPLGSGFGTYGTSLSYMNGSKVYQLYNEINYNLMMDPRFGFASMSDTYWPAIYAQLGFFGFLLFIYCLYCCFRYVMRASFSKLQNRQACMVIMIYMLVISMTEAVYINETGVTAAIIIAIILNLSDKGRCLRIESQSLIGLNRKIPR